MPEGAGRVEEVYVGFNSTVKAGDPIFKLDSSEEEAALLTAQRRVTETDAAFSVAQTDLAGAEAKIQEAQSSLQQAIRRIRNQDGTSKA